MYKVLIVDDEQNIRNGLSILIDWNKLGFSEVDTAEDGDEALEKIKEKKVHLIITDIRMPGMSGLQLIQKVKEINPAIRIVILSGYNEFAYAKEAMGYGVKEYILKPVVKNELIQLVQRIKDEIDEEIKNIINTAKKNNLVRDKLLLDIGNGKYITANEAISTSSYEIQLEATCYCIYIVEVEKIKQIVEVNQVEAKLVLFYVRNIIEDLIQDNQIAYVYEEEDMRLGIIAFSEEANTVERAIKHDLITAQTHIKEIFNQDICIACGSFVSSFQDIKHSKEQALYALRRKHLFSNRQLCIYNQGALEENKNLNIDWDTSRLLTAVEERDIDAIVNQVKYLINEMIDKEMEKPTMHALVVHNLLELRKLILKHNGDEHSLSINANIISNINKKEDFTLLEEWLVKLCIRVGQYISEVAKQAYPSSINEIKKYINEHFFEELSLKSMASMFYMNSAYLGRLFKITTNQSFNDYLNKRRISEVKKLYASSNLKINEILHRAGYNSSDYFYRVFKKHEGLNFSEYCEKIRSNISN